MAANSWDGPLVPLVACAAGDGEARVRLPEAPAHELQARALVALVEADAAHLTSSHPFPIHELQRWKTERCTRNAVQLVTTE